jgi:hypothetical protein
MAEATVYFILALTQSFDVFNPIFQKIKMKIDWRKKNLKVKNKFFIETLVTWFCLLSNVYFFYVVRCANVVQETKYLLKFQNDRKN